jgi:hypothetical protein
MGQPTMDRVTTYRVPTAAVARAVANAKEATHAAETLLTHCKKVQHKLERHLESQSRVPVDSPVAPVAAVSVLMTSCISSSGRRGRRSSGRGSSSSRISSGRGSRCRGSSGRRSRMALASRSPRRVPSPRAIQRSAGGGSRGRSRSRRLTHTHTQSPARNCNSQSGTQSPAQRAELLKLPVPAEIAHLRFKDPPACKAFPSWKVPGCTLIATMTVWVKRRHNQNAWVCAACSRHLESEKMLRDSSEHPTYVSRVLNQTDLDLYPSV